MIRRGSAYEAYGEVAGMAIGHREAICMAKGSQIIWKKNPEIYSIISAPQSVDANQEFEIEVTCNAHTNYVVTYTVSSEGSQSGLPRTVKKVKDAGDGKRDITVSMSIGTPGSRTIRLYAAAQSSNSTQYMGTEYVETVVRILSVAGDEDTDGPDNVESEVIE